MDINHHENIIYKLSNMPDDALTEVDLSFHLVRKQKESDSYYQSTCIQLAPDVIKWLKKSIVNSLQELKEVDDAERQVFLVGDYNHEIKLNDRIAKFVLDDDDDQGLIDKVTKLVKALRCPDPEYPEKHTKFQIVKLTLGEKDAYFCYYRGVKKNSIKSSKKMMVIKNSNQFVFAEDTVVDLGGNIDFFIIENCIFIINVRSFEYAFEYKDHITERRDQNIAQIISMPFFHGKDSNREAFEKSCKKHIYSRTLAQIKPETMAAIKENFDARCDELSQIKANEPQDQDAKEQYVAKYSSLWGLFEYIDLENRKIIFTEDSSPKPLIHFFADKIVKSFVTENYKVAVAYEQ